MTRRRSAMIIALLLPMALGPLPPSSPTTRAAAAALPPPAFRNYVAPASLGRDAGEPSVGVNWATGAVMYQAGTQTLRVTGFNAAAGTATWTDVSPLLTSVETADPILFTDRRTDRTFVSQLAAGCSLMATSDDDGASWFQNPLGCGLPAGVDHQSIGGGPFAPPFSATGYPDAVYYCAHSVVTALCSISLDGGLTFGPGVPIYTAAQCQGGHGHVKVAPDGTVYVPNADCGGRQGVAVSTNGGLSWSVRTVSVSTTQSESDPSVAVGSGGRVYLGWQGGDGHPRVAVSTNRGQSWFWVRDVGASMGIKNAQFPTVVAGDDNRAAFAFLGTKAAGNDQAPGFKGVWHLYVATTYNGGSTWTTVDATPTNPVQRGCIWMGGPNTFTDCRNLLDFMDATVDKTGNVVVAYADGCAGNCASGSVTFTRSAIATIARQSGGTRLFG